jgi:GT2 family glycosyltransferase
LGDSVLESPLEIECNCAVRRKEFLRVGGFNPKLFGHEGVDLSYRLRNSGKLLYIPSVIIYHDRGDNLKHYLRKQYRHAYNSMLLVKNYNQVISYYNQFTYPSRPNIDYRLSILQRFQMIILTFLSFGSAHAGSLSYRIKVVFLKKEASIHTQ